MGWLAVPPPLILLSMAPSCRASAITATRRVQPDHRASHRPGRSGCRLPALAAELVRLSVGACSWRRRAWSPSRPRARRHHPNCDGSKPRPARTRARGESRGAGGAMCTSLTNSTNPDFSGEQIQLLKEVVPEASHLAVLAHSDDIRRGVLSREIGPAVALLKLGSRSWKSARPTMSRRPSRPRRGACRSAAGVETPSSSVSGRGLLTWRPNAVALHGTFRELADAGCRCAVTRALRPDYPAGRLRRG